MPTLLDAYAYIKNKQTKKHFKLKNNLSLHNIRVNLNGQLPTTFILGSTITTWKDWGWLQRVSLTSQPLSKYFNLSNGHKCSLPQSCRLLLTFYHRYNQLNKKKLEIKRLKSVNWPMISKALNSPHAWSMKPLSWSKASHSSYRYKFAPSNNNGLLNIKINHIEKLHLTVAAPWFPVEAVITPLVRKTSSFDSLRVRSLLKAPLSLKDPVICSLSILMKIDNCYLQKKHFTVPKGEQTTLKSKSTFRTKRGYLHVSENKHTIWNLV